jgi:hypothetical protein
MSGEGDRMSTAVIPEPIAQLQRQLDQIRSTQPRGRKLPESVWQAAADAFPDELQPGTWHKADFIITPASAAQLGMLSISMTTGRVSLHRE